MRYGISETPASTPTHPHSNKRSNIPSSSQNSARKGAHKSPQASSHARSPSVSVSVSVSFPLPHPQLTQRRTSTYGLLHSDSESDDYQFDSEAQGQDEDEDKDDHHDNAYPSESDSDNDADSNAEVHGSSGENIFGDSEDDGPSVRTFSTPKSKSKSARTNKRHSKPKRTPLSNNRPKSDPTSPHRPLSPREQRVIADTVAVIRMRAHHHDVYEEWEQQTRQDAFRTARRKKSESDFRRHEAEKRLREHELERLRALHAQQAAEVAQHLASMEKQQQTAVAALQQRWRDQAARMRERIEVTIQFEEEKMRKRIEAERKAREEEERKQREAEEKRRAEEERVRKEEEERKAREEREREERRKAEEAERARAQREKAEQEQRKALGLMTAEEDWANARETLKKLKTGPLKSVKGNKELKSQWSALRRQITPKIGQLTNDMESIGRISRQLVEIIQPLASRQLEVYLSTLSSLAKAILLQAETEVTAEKRSAFPLAHVTVYLLGQLEHFAQIFFAKLVQRCGGWPVPVVIPSTDIDGKPWPDEDARTKAMGYRMADGERESPADFIARVVGVMRVYFIVLVAETDRPLEKMFHKARFWNFFARMLAEPRLLETAVGPQVLYAALDVGGLEAKATWGPQWVKLIEMLYQGVTVGLDASSDKIIGGQTAEGKAARVRVQLEIERIMAGAV